MKKKLIILVILFFFLYLLPIPEYVELNHLAFIRSMDIVCKNNDEYEITLKEIIPKKQDNSIEYDYKNYTEVGNSIETVKKKLEENSSKKMYYERINKITTNCSDVDSILATFSLSKKHISIKEKK